MDTKEVLIQLDPSDPTLLTPATPITKEEAEKLPVDQVVRVEGGKPKVFSPVSEKKADEMLIQKLTKERNEWKDAWSRAAALGGKMYWDGATWGYTQGLKDSSAYRVNERAPETAHDISILISVVRKTTGADAMVEACDNLEPLTYFVVKYNTGDQILFQYVAGKPKVVRIKTHDGWTCEPGKPLAKNIQTSIFQAIP